MRRLLFAASILVSGLPLQAAEPCVTLDGKAVAALFDEWNFALSSLDATKVAQRYWPDAVLLPTVSNTPRTNPAAINDYFEHFLPKRPRGHVDTRTVQAGCNLAVDMGTYTFSMMDDKGTTSEVAARYTFVYQYRDGAWKILHHHSSAMPEGNSSVSADAHAVKEESAEVRAAAKPEPVRPASRKERKANRKEVPKPESVVAKPVEKLAASPVAETKVAAADVKSPAAGKAAEAGKAPEAVKTTDASKVPVAASTPEAKAASDAKAAATPAPATDGKMPPEVRTAMFANLTSSPPPSKFYPPEAARRKEKGSVNLKVCADGTGTVSENMEVVRSSGSKLLDDAAMSWARSVTWVPATFNRRRVEGCAKVDVSFEPLPEMAQARN